MKLEYIYEKERKMRILEVFNEGCGLVCVADSKERIIGVIGQKEAGLLNESDVEITAGELCNRNFKYARKGYEKEDVRKIFEESILWNIPILDENRHLVGMYSRARFILENFQSEKVEENREIFVSYAQWEEDVILDWILKGVSNIFYIDGGANSPTIHSVTKNAYKYRGARGINIEPVQYYYQELVKDRTRDINLNCCIGAETGSLVFWQDGGFSTGIESHKTIKAIKAKMPVRTLESICEEYVDINQEIHFMKLDIEGMEYEALQGMSFSKYRPWVLCLERNQNEDKIKEYLTEHGYVLVRQYDVNDWWIAKEHLELVERLVEKEKIRENYSIEVISWYTMGISPDTVLSK